MFNSMLHTFWMQDEAVWLDEAESEVSVNLACVQIFTVPLSYEMFLVYILNNYLNFKLYFI